jgi:hypothetical protein
MKVFLENRKALKKYFQNLENCKSAQKGKIEREDERGFNQQKEKTSGHIGSCHRNDDA